MSVKTYKFYMFEVWLNIISMECVSMGFFNYSKPGPGIDKNAPKKKGVALYLELFFRKFWELIRINVLYFIFSIPAFFIYFCLFTFFILPDLSALIRDMISMLETDVANADVILSNYSMAIGIAFSVLIVILWGSGPASASWAYIMRCFTRESHTWLWADFKNKLKENFGQSIIVLAVDIVFMFMSSISIRYYASMYSGTKSIVYIILCLFMVLLFLIYTLMHAYIYQFMITFKGNIVRIYRNALVFAIGFLPMNLLLNIIPALVTAIVFMYLNPYFSVILALLIWISLCRYPIDFYASRVIFRKLLSGDK